MRESYLPIFSSSIMLNQPSRGDTHLLYGILLSLLLRVTMASTIKRFPSDCQYLTPPSRTLWETALIDFHFSYVLSAEKEINILWSAWSMKSCMETHCSWAFHESPTANCNTVFSLIAAVWIMVLYMPSHTLYAACYHNHLRWITFLLHGLEEH